MVASTVSRELWRRAMWALVVLGVFAAFVAYGRAVESANRSVRLTAAEGAAAASASGTTSGTDPTTGAAPDAGSDAGSGEDAEPTKPPKKLAVVGAAIDALAGIIPAAPSLLQVGGGNAIAVLNLLPPEVFGPVLQAYSSLLEAATTGAVTSSELLRQLNAALGPLAEYANPLASVVGATTIDAAAAGLRGGEEMATLLGHHTAYLSWLADNLTVYKRTFGLEP